MLPQRKNEKKSINETDRQSVNPASLPTVQLLCNESVRQELTLDRPQLLIGRSEDNDISIPSSYVSWHHILLFRHWGSTILIDLDSTNGTFVNSKRVHSHVLADNDVITVDLHSAFVRYSIRYLDPLEITRGKLGDIEDVDAVIARALKEAADLLGMYDTDLIPTPSENLPTKVGFIDDR